MWRNIGGVTDAHADGKKRFEGGFGVVDEVWVEAHRGWWEEEEEC